MFTTAADVLYVIKCGSAGYYMTQERFESSQKYAVISVIISVMSFVISCGWSVSSGFWVTEAINDALLILSSMAFFLLMFKVKEQTTGDTNSIY